MKITSFRVTALALLGAAMMFAVPTKASAAAYMTVRFGTPPPPPPAVVYQPWHRPYREAVWIPGHNEWINGRWVWIGGYYAYPPRRGAVWVGPRYHHNYYYTGYWR